MEKELKAVLDAITGCSFASIVYTTEYNEKQQSIINIGIDLKVAKQKDIEWLENVDITTLDTDLPLDIMQQAKEELLHSLKNPNPKRSNGNVDAFTYIGNNLKQHNITNDIYIVGFAISKKVLQVGEKKVDTRKPLTKAKDIFRDEMKHTKYRIYNINRAEKFKVNGDTIFFECTEVAA